MKYGIIRDNHPTTHLTMSPNDCGGGWIAYCGRRVFILNVPARHVEPRERVCKSCLKARGIR